MSQTETSLKKKNDSFEPDDGVETIISHHPLSFSKPIHTNIKQMCHAVQSVCNAHSLLFIVGGQSG